VSERQPLSTTLEILQHLVSFDTTSANRNSALIGYVSDLLGGHGIGVHLTWDQERRKANLLATIGSTERPGLVLSGHSDVVPVTGQSWQSDPFRLHLREDKLFGRGTADMKGFVACTLALVEHFRHRGDRVPVHIALSYDEEVGCHGMPDLLDDLTNRVAPPCMAVVGEPSRMGVINAHKGVRLFNTVMMGQECHSSDPRQGANAGVAAARLAVFLDTLGEESIERAEACPSAQRFDPGWSTVNVGIIHAGTAHNIVPREARVGWELRLLPDDDPDFVPHRADRYIKEELMPWLRRTSPNADYTTTMLCDIPGLKPEHNGFSEAICLQALGSTRTSTVSYGSDAGLIQAAGISTVICGPGDINQAHKPDEFITTDQLSRCLTFLRDVQELLDT
jgi:acetylornithine deacetylase